jgi:hypothetical protein
MRPAIILDIDGTLADSFTYLSQNYCGWDDFHSQLASFRLLDNGVAELAQDAVTQGIAVHMVTCRPAIYRKVTVNWLVRHRLPFTSLWMRPQGVKDEDFKRQALASIEARHKVILAVDDNPRELQMYREEGVLCLDINSGCYEPTQPWRTDAEVRSYEVGCVGGNEGAGAGSLRQ